MFFSPPASSGSLVKDDGIFQKGGLRINLFKLVKVIVVIRRTILLEFDEHVVIFMANHLTLLAVNHAFGDSAPIP